MSVNTVSSLLGWGRRTLQAAGIPDAPVEARLLLQHAADLGDVRLWTDHNAGIDSGPARYYRELILNRVQTRIPVHYLTREIGFCSLSFIIRPGVFIPRPETEHLVEEALSLLSAIESPRVADIGTGAGVVAVSLAAARTDSTVYAIDIDPQACDCARDNAVREGVADRVAVIQGDMLHAVPPDTEPLDMVVSNPPYIRSVDIDGLAPEIRLHEPRAALDGGWDGLDFYRSLLSQAQSRCCPDGLLVMELGAGQSREVLPLALGSGVYSLVRIGRDYAGHDRVLSLKVR